MLTKVVWSNEGKLEKVRKVYNANWVVNVATLIIAAGLYIYSWWLERNNQLITVDAD